MASLVTAPLGSKENPHPTLVPIKDRIKGHYYIYNLEVRYWNGYNLINKDKTKEYYEKNKEKIKEQRKEYRENNKEKIKERTKEYYEKNKEKIKEQVKEYYDNNKEKIKENVKKYRENNKEKIKEYLENNKERLKEYREKNKEKIKEQTKEYCKKRRKNDPVFRLTHNTRKRVYKALKAQKASKNQRTMEYVNCSVAQLHNHIESQFKDSGMNWDNMGGRGWEIDHRRPCASFDLNDEEQKYMCFHWTNLQPMWGEENNRKSDSYDPSTFRYKWWGKEIGWLGIPKYLMPNTSKLL